MKARELREMSGEQMQLTLNETIKSLFHLRMQQQTETKATNELRKSRRLIARIKTLQNERQRKAAAASAAAAASVTATSAAESGGR